MTRISGMLASGPNEPPNEKEKTDIGMYSLGQYQSRPHRVGSLLGCLRRMVTINTEAWERKETYLSYSKSLNSSFT